MAVIETLSVALTARTKQFTTAFARARKTLKKFRTGVIGTIGKIAGLGAALVGIGSIAGLGAFVSRMSDGIDKTFKFAQRLGTTTEELVSLRFAAKQAGIAQNAFDVSLQRLVRRSAEAAKGTGEARIAFKNLNIDAKEFAQLPLGQKISVLSEKFAQLGDSGEAVLNAFKLFDTEGVGNLVLLKKGPELLEKMRRRAEQLGITFSNFDAAKVAAAKDAMSELRELFVGIGQTLAIELAPFITAFANKMVEAGIQGEGLGVKVVGAFEATANAIANALRLVNLLKGAWFGFKGVVELVAGTVIKSFSKMQRAILETLNKVPGINIGLGAVNSNVGIGESFLKESRASFAKAASNAQSFATGELTTSVKSFFADVRRKANEAAKAATSATEPEGFAPGGSRDTDPFGARAIDLANTFVGSLSQGGAETKVTDKVVAGKVDTTNRLLGRLVDTPALTS